MAVLHWSHTLDASSKQLTLNINVAGCKKHAKVRMHCTFTYLLKYWVKPSQCYFNAIY